MATIGDFKDKLTVGTCFWQRRAGETYTPYHCRVVSVEERGVVAELIGRMLTSRREREAGAGDRKIYSKGHAILEEWKKELDYLCFSREELADSPNILN